MLEFDRDPLLDKRIKLRHIVTFLEVARLRSVVQAAAALNVSQPAASKTIQELEGLLGLPLFDRSKRRLALTSFGEVFLRYAGVAVSALRQGVQAAVHAGASEPVSVTIGASPTAAAQLLPTAISHFTRQGYGFRPRVVDGPNAYLMSQMRLGEIDLVIGRMAEPDAMIGFSFDHLYSERLSMVVRVGHPLLGLAPLELGALSKFQILIPPPDAFIRPIVDRFFVANAIGPFDNIVETVSSSFGRRYTRSSNAIWVMSEGVLADDIKDGVLAQLPVDMTDTVGPVGLTRWTARPLSVAAELFIQSVHRAVAARTS